MTTRLSTWPRLLTVSEYLELGELEYGYSELNEGRVVITPSPILDHNFACAEFRDHLKQYVPPHLEVILDVDVDLQLAADDEPGFCRRPDLIVVDRSARVRQRREGGIVRASDVTVVVEFVSHGSRRTDHVVKRSEYADAGIPHYWIVDLDEPASLLACHLAGEFGYADQGATSGIFRTTDPFTAEIDLTTLL